MFALQEIQNALSVLLLIYVSINIRRKKHDYATHQFKKNRLIN